MYKALRTLPDTSRALIVLVTVLLLSLVVEVLIVVVVIPQEAKEVVIPQEAKEAQRKQWLFPHDELYREECPR